MTPLHWFGDWVRTIMMQIPLPLVRALYVGSLVLILLWVLRLPKEETTPPDGAKRWDENLKVWAAAALLIQIAIYSVF